MGLSPEVLLDDVSDGSAVDDEVLFVTLEDELIGM